MVPVALGLPLDKATARRLVDERQELRARRELALLWRRLVRSQGAYHRGVHRALSRHLAQGCPVHAGRWHPDEAA